MEDDTDIRDQTVDGSAETRAAGEPMSHFSSTQKWKQLSGEGEFRPGPRSGAASAVHESCLYIFGGYGGNGRLDDLCEYNFNDQRWRKLTTKGTPPAGRENNGAIIYNNAMYIFGGYSGFYWLNDFHRLDLNTLEWSLMIP
jgi:N-acetylneuraminic acid mutarotase